MSSGTRRGSNSGTEGAGLMMRDHNTEREARFPCLHPCLKVWHAGLRGDDLGKRLVACQSTVCGSFTDLLFSFLRM